ncbi:hypothetical protein D9756_002387 [Leucocoprinus leucothites]|uniref:Uncharacterized protein n=1 Tax=Leucocoprinus leucothites TaxID=201217 RepID=A0A8H5GCM3_9AGAR|nr:hypothetical protein D9756_002387 [Leucoagaricus leucothites]
MANIGSAFLGDLQAKRIRHLSSPTGSIGATSPPSSPPATTTQNNHMSISQPLSPPPQEPQSTSRSQRDEELRKAWVALASPPLKTTIDPILALELRVQWLEALVLGISGPAQTSNSSASKNGATGADRKSSIGMEKEQKGRGNFRSLRGKAGEKSKENEKDKGKGKESTATLARLTEDVTKRLNTIVEANEGLRKFMDTYEQHAQYLTPTFALSGIIDAPLPSTPTSDNQEGKTLGSSLLPMYENMSPQELEAFLAELEPDVRAADRDMLEIESLVGKGVTGSGKLGDYEALKPRLQKLIKEHEEDARLASDLERRVAKLVERHVNHVDTLSELFVAWDDTLLEAESRANKLEKDARERQRLGLEP